MTNKKPDFSFIRYANCWEDADLLYENLKPSKGDNILSIASAGDNSLGFLAFDPEYVLAFDVNPTQLFLSELKQKAIQYLDYDDVLKFLGVNACKDRLKLYNTIKSDLSLDAQNFFNNHLNLIQNGIIYSGKFENYFKLFSRFVLPLIHSKSTVDALFSPKNAQQQRDFYNNKWNNRRWKWLFKLFFSKAVMGRFGRDPAFFNEVTSNVGDEIFKRAENHLSSVLVSKNHFLEFQLKGTFKLGLPFYLRPENFHSIKANIHKIKFVKAYLTEIHINEKFDCFNLSNIFEYMDVDTFKQQAEHIKFLSNPQAKIAYWNLLVPRQLDRCDSNYKSVPINGNDLCFFYQSMYLNIL